MEGLRGKQESPLQSLQTLNRDKTLGLFRGNVLKEPATELIDCKHSNIGEKPTVILDLMKKLESLKIFPNFPNFYLPKFGNGRALPGRCSSISIFWKVGKLENMRVLLQPLWSAQTATKIRIAQLKSHP